MARFLFTSVPVEGHSASPLTTMARLVDDGHDVVWLAGARYADRARRAGVHHVPIWVSTDYSLYDDPFDVCPELRGLSGIEVAEGPCSATYSSAMLRRRSSNSSNCSTRSVPTCW